MDKERDVIVYGFPCASGLLTSLETENTANNDDAKFHAHKVESLIWIIILWMSGERKLVKCGNFKVQQNQGQQIHTYICEEWKVCLA